MRIMFYAMGSGIPNQDTKISNFAFRVAPGGLAYDHGEGVSGRGGSIRKKQKILD